MAEPLPVRWDRCREHALFEQRPLCFQDVFTRAAGEPKRPRVLSSPVRRPAAARCLAPWKTVSTTTTLCMDTSAPSAGGPSPPVSCRTPTSWSGTTRHSRSWLSTRHVPVPGRELHGGTRDSRDREEHLVTRPLTLQTPLSDRESRGPARGCPQKPWGRTGRLGRRHVGVCSEHAEAHPEPPREAGRRPQDAGCHHHLSRSGCCRRIEGAGKRNRQQRWRGRCRAPPLGPRAPETRPTALLVLGPMIDQLREARGHGGSRGGPACSGTGPLGGDRGAGSSRHPHYVLRHMEYMVFPKCCKWLATPGVMVSI